MGGGGGNFFCYSVQDCRNEKHGISNMESHQYYEKLVIMACLISPVFHEVRKAWSFKRGWKISSTRKI